MTRLVWSHQFSIGVDYINKQHKYLLNLVNQVEDAIAAGSSRQEIASFLTAFIEYCETHFQDEEELMRVIQYPEEPSRKG